MSEPGELQIQSVNLEAFEKIVYLSDGSFEATENICRELFYILNQTRQGSGFMTDNDAVQSILWTRMAGAITAFLVNPRHGLTRDGFINLCSKHTLLHAIFKASSYETMDHVLACLSEPVDGDVHRRTFSSEQSILKMLICWSLDSEVDIDFAAVAQAAPEATAWAILGMLSVGGSHSPRSYDRRVMLMAHRNLIANASLPVPLLICAADCYMHCSYVDLPDKHEIKRVINQKMRETVESLIHVEECTRPSVRKDRPTILMPLEWFGSHHAMFRCYAPAILELKARFRMVALFRDNQEEVNDEARVIFDKCILMPMEGSSIDTVAKAIREEDPDIMYYPSIGMSAWYVALSNFRLAPLQIMAPGHPATSTSANIDYIISDGELFGDPSNYTEKLIALATGTTRYIATASAWEKPVHIERNDGVVRIAIPAMVIKLVPPFLSTLLEIQKKAKKKVEFRFFPNMVGMNHFTISKELKRWFQDVSIMPRVNYKQYIEWLGQCDLALSTFPFGGTNSTIDCFLAGLPVLTLEGPHIHGRSDASMMRRVKLPEWLMTHSKEEYITAALRLIDGDEIPVLRAHLQGFDVQKEFYGEAPAHLKGGYTAAFERVYAESCAEPQ